MSARLVGSIGSDLTRALRLLMLLGLSLLSAALSLPDSLAPGRVAVITGAGAGLGKAAACKCAALGMHVVLVDVSDADLDSATSAVSDHASDSADVMSVCVDVSDRTGIFELRDAVVERFGQVNFLMSNAGTGKAAPSLLRDFEAWQRNLDVNLHGNINVLQAFVPHILEQQETPATIVVTGSKQGITCPPGNLAYNAAKSALKVIAEGLQHELRGSEHATRVRAHLFVPGFVNTNLAVNYFKELKGDDFDPAEVPWSEDKPAKGGWMPDQTIEYLLERVAAQSFYIICPDNDVTPQMDAKRIAWAAGDMVVRDVPLSRWDPAHKAAFAEFMETGELADALRE